MRTMTCKQMGGACTKKISANTSKQMAEKMTAHVMKEHPKIAEKMSKMTKAQHATWEKKFHKDWDAAAATKTKAKTKKRR